MRLTREKTRRGITPSPAGISFLGSGLEIKDRETQQQKQQSKGLKGYYTEGRGFFESQHAAYSAQDVQRLLDRLKAKQAGYFHF